MEMLRADLPKDLPVVYISAVTGYGLQELKDILWEELNSESNKLQSVSEGGSIIHRDREVNMFNHDFIDWEIDYDDEADIDDFDEEIEVYDMEDLED